MLLPPTLTLPLTPCLQGPGLNDACLHERTANLITSLPFLGVGVRTIRWGRLGARTQGRGSGRRAEACGMAGQGLRDGGPRPAGWAGRGLQDGGPRPAGWRAARHSGVVPCGL